ncbi:MAG: hypothetical protein AB1810_05635 [Pseudomonadota bacterium]
MAKPTANVPGKGVTFKISYQERPEFKGATAGFLFDSAGNLMEAAEVKDGRLSFARSEQEIGRSRLYIAPVPENLVKIEPSIKMMQRLGAFEPVVRVGGKLIDTILVPGIIIDHWPICFCWVRGRVVKTGSGRPVCGAKVHICEVDKVWRWILTLPEIEIFRLRDDLLEVLREPPIPRPPRPEPDPWPIKVDLIRGASVMGRGVRPATQRLSSATRMISSRLNPQPEVPSAKLSPQAALLSALPVQSQTALQSPSAQIVRQTLVDNVHLIIPYLCLWPWWWRFRCDEITVVTTDSLGRFQAIVPYLCAGDKPDLYFWVEYEIGGVLETVYHPPIACNTYWDYACGTEVTIHVNDDRVPACDDEPDLPGCVVQMLSIGHQVSMSEIHGPGATSADEGQTTDGRPFGGKLEPRVWFSRDCLRNVKNIKYYRWSYRRLTTGDGAALGTPGPWTPLTRTVVRHYAKPASGGGITHEPYVLGPQTIGAQTNLFEIKPSAVPAGGIEWTVVDEREDLASAHFMSHLLGSGATDCEKALDAAGKYELKLELFKQDGSLVDWTAEGIDPQVTNVPAPFGTGSVTAVSAPDYNRIKNAAGHTLAFRMVLRVDNNCCAATVAPVSGTGLTITPCGFIEYGPGATANLHFEAHHPNGFADFRFSVVRGVSTTVSAASASGKGGAASVATDDASHAYTLAPPSDYQESFAVMTLLGPCDRAAFSEALHVWARATDGYSRLSHLDDFAHDGFALSQPCPPCPPCECAE